MNVVSVRLQLRLAIARSLQADEEAATDEAANVEAANDEAVQAVESAPLHSPMTGAREPHKLTSAITIRGGQLAWAILAGFKIIENRNFRLLYIVRAQVWAACGQDGGGVAGS
jgi:hypothetical protein